MGYVAVTSQVGSGLAPWIAKGLQKFDRKVPFLVMGTIAVIGSLLLSSLPETKGEKTCELLESSGDSKAAQVEETGLLVMAEENDATA